MRQVLTVCFSATSSIVAGIAVSGIGAATIPLVRNRRELAFAALPLVFGVHQLLEGLIWLQLDDADAQSIRTPLVGAWLLIAWTFLPIWVPLSVAWFEPDARRRRAMYGLAGLGAVVGVYLVVASMVRDTTVHVNQHHLQYDGPAQPGWLIGLPYVAATCLPLLLSSRRFVFGFGVALAASMAVTLAISSYAFSSVWCFFAALLSIGLFAHYYVARRSERAAMELAHPQRTQPVTRSSHQRDDHGQVITPTPPPPQRS